MLANYHTHTFRCHHAIGSDREFIEKAIYAGIKILGFSDHCPWVYKNGYVSDIRMTPDEVGEYFSSFTSLKKAYANDIKIYIGFEAEYIPELIEEQDKFLSGFPLDFMILGEHSTAPEYESIYTGRASDNEAALKKYVDLSIEAMNSGRYLYMAHPDLFNFTGADDIYEKHYTRLCECLKALDVPIEINLLGVADRRHYTSEKFLSIAKKVGNKAIIGLDAHIPDAFGDSGNIKKCYALADKYSLEIVEFLEIDKSKKLLP